MLCDIISQFLHNDVEGFFGGSTRIIGKFDEYTSIFVMWFNRFELKSVRLDLVEQRRKPSKERFFSEHPDVVSETKSKGLNIDSQSIIPLKSTEY